MSESDSFISEVSDELRRDRLFAFFRRWGPFLIAGLVLLVGASAYLEWRRIGDDRSAAQRGDAMLAAVRTEAPEARAAALAGLATDAGDRGVIPALLEAEALAASEQADAALATLDRVIDDAAVSPVYRDLARLHRLGIRGDAVPIAERIAELDQMVGPDAPFRLVALEARGLARLQSGDIAAAREDLTAVAGDPLATRDLRGRVLEVLRALGTPPEAVPAAAPGSSGEVVPAGPAAP